jgi:hypothetical protein
MRASLVINNFNYDPYVAVCIESCLNQTYPDCEVIVVDDGSTDSSRDVIRQYSSRIIQILKGNGGQASALNAGFEASSGELVIFVDADDFLYPHAVEMVMKGWNRCCAKLHFRLHRVDQVGKVIGFEPNTKYRLSGGDAVRELLDEGSIVAPPTTGNAFARRVLEAVFPVPEKEFKICADEYLITTSVFHGPLVALDECLGAYRIHGKNRHANIQHTDRINHMRRALDRAGRRQRLIDRECIRTGRPIRSHAVMNNVQLRKYAIWVARVDGRVSLTHRLDAGVGLARALVRNRRYHWLRKLAEGLIALALLFVPRTILLDRRVSVKETRSK